MKKKVVIITGASRGIGRAIAQNLSEYRLVLVSRNQEDLDALADELNKNGAEAFGIACNVNVEVEVMRVFRSAIEKYGTIDILINNAGIGQFKRVDQFSLEEFNEIYNVNVIGTFLFSKYVAPILIEKKEGQIINIASVAGLNGFKTGTAYAASKFAVVGFTESLREDLKEFGIAVTAICPGSVNTTFGGMSEEAKEESDYALEPEDVARTVRYLVKESETANAKLIELKPRRKKESR